MRAREKTFRHARQLRRDLSVPEVIPWDCLRARRLQGLRFRRQDVIGPYVLDFSYASTKAACEISTLPNCRRRFLPSFCFFRSLRLRVTSPP
ncbi:MAG: DUF559 domain-containing protein [Brucellaceae bacterium]|nr:DUF559 domain-containing protein [Brucellaceae bacterium]